MQKRSDHKSKKGTDVRRLFIRDLELEYWVLMDELKEAIPTSKYSDVIRYAIKKAAGRI